VNSWTKRAIGVAALAGGLLALGAGTAGAQEASTGASVRTGSAPTVEVRLCGDGVALSGLLGRCGGQAGSGSGSTTVQADGNRARVRVSGAGPVRASLEARPSRPRASVSGRATITRPAGLAPSVAADVAADTSPRARITAGVASLTARPLGPAGLSAGPSAAAKVAIMLAREGMAGGGDATATVDLAAPPTTADAAVSVGHDATATDADAAVDLGLLGPADPAAATADATVTVGRDGLGDPAAAAVDATLAAGHDAAATDAEAAVALGLLGPADEAGAAADATLAVGLPGLGDPGSSGVDAAADLGLSGPAVPAPGGLPPTLPVPVGDISLDGLLGAVDSPELDVGGLVPSTSGTVCVGACGADTGTGGTPAPTQPSPTPPASDGSGGQDTSTAGISAPDQAGATGTDGMLAGAAGAAGTALARLRSALGGSAGALPFTGGAGDLLAIVALGLLMAGALLLRAARPAPVAERR
jgi:hypothetical protein